MAETVLFLSRFSVSSRSIALRSSSEKYARIFNSCPINNSKIGSSPLKGCGGNCGPGGK